MAAKLNLLPPDYAISGSVRQLLKLAKPLNVILLSLFLITVLGMGGFFIFSSFSLNNLKATNTKLEGQIKAQEAAQQQIVLLKDRLGQIKTVQSLPNAAKNLTNVDPYLSILSPNSIISELDVDAQKTSSSIVFRSNSELSAFMKNLNTNKVFSTISLNTFSFNPSGGYLVGVDYKLK